MTLFVLCLCNTWCLLQSLQCLSVRHIVPSVDFVSLVLSTDCPISVSTSNCTVRFICFTISNAHCYRLHAASLYITLYCLLVLFHKCPLLFSSVPPQSISTSKSAICWFIDTVSIPASILPPLSVSTTQCNVGWFCLTVSTAIFCKLTTVYHYRILYRLLVPNIASSVCSFSLCSLLSSTNFRQSIRTSPSIVCWFFVTVSTRLLQYLHCLSVPHIVTSVGSLSLSALFSCTVSSLSDSTSHCLFCLFCVTVSVAAVCIMYTVSVTHILLPVFLCHYAHCSLLKHLHCLSCSHTEPPVGFESP